MPHFHLMNAIIGIIAILFAGLVAIILDWVASKYSPKYGSIIVLILVGILTFYFFGVLSE